ncbi:hypothetical protein [Haliangium sp.]|uniref:hypothetical protein n=1 Tax=Haliangium sp. TaxID=2663208 RepID=UPI003D0BEF38
MAKQAHDTWTVLEHDPIEELTDNLWRVEGALPRMALRRQMLVARTSDGRLLIHNGVALEEPLMKRIEDWGRPTWLVVPNGWHRLDAPSFKARYPDIQVIAPRGSRGKIEQVVPVDIDYDQFEPVLGEDGEPELRLFHLRGLRDAEGMVELRSRDGVTLICNDAIFNQPHLPGVFGAIYRLLGQSGRPKVTIIARWFMMKDKRAFAEHLRELAQIPNLARVAPAHIDLITGDPAAVLAGLADELS